MDVESASTFLSCAILIGAGFAVIGIALVFLNNIIHKYWKPVRFFTEDSWGPFKQPPYRLAEPEARIPPELDKTHSKQI